MQNDPLFFNTYLDNLNRIEQDDALSIADKNKALFSLFSALIEDVTTDFDVTFTTLFSRLAFLTSQFEGIEKKHRFFLHRYRNLNEKGFDSKYGNDVFELGVSLIKSILELKKGNFTFDFYSTKDIFTSTKKKDINTLSKLKVLVFDINREDKTLVAYDEERGHEAILIRYDVSDKNELFTDDLESAFKIYGIPLIINLIDISIDEDHIYTPMGFVLDPDYLVDVTRIASTFVNKKIEANLTLLRRFEQIDSTKKPLLLGNIANMLFDEVLQDPNASFKKQLPKIFRMNPLALALYDNNQVLELVKDAKKHFTNLKNVVNSNLKKVNITRENVYLEPSFYSDQYGLQGRLDLLHVDEQFDIIELKSGSPFKPNKYGLSESHYVQTLLYDMMISSAFGTEKTIRNYILYSKEKEQPLRYAPTIKAKQTEAIHARNRLVLLDYYMTKGASQTFTVLNSFTEEKYAHIRGFDKKNIENLEKKFQKLTTLEQAYVAEFMSFVAREQRLAKVGEHGLYKDNGLAGLWLEVNSEKEARFSLLKQLEIVSIKDAIVTLKRSESTSPLADFRAGDIVVFYPYNDTPSAVLKNQIFKSTIVEIEDNIVIKLRSTQYNEKIFESHQQWNIEKDIMDSSFNVMYRSLMEFSKKSKDKRNLLLGNKMPQDTLKEYTFDDNLSKEQNGLIQSILNADDYYLLWGPPGTGKTSVMIKKLAHHMSVHETKPFLLLAYTNKAVDEICEAIKGLEYIRIGAEQSCGTGYKHRLLSYLSQDITSRQQVLDLLNKHNIFVGTVSSVLGKQELFQLKNFGTVIIDEASQILEPMMMGILSKVDKFILVGDHNQLPAVVKQHHDTAQISYQPLVKMGITDMKMSFFERLYHQCRTHGWNDAFGILTHQGRMHKDLMQFINKKNYNGLLSIFEKTPRLKAPHFFSPNFELSDRKIFIPTPIDNNINWKTNEYEAQKVADLIKMLCNRYEIEGKKFTPDSIGIIAPYRAHIALIDKYIRKECPEVHQYLTIDTVERYQGGARDIIILSLCTNNPRQFETLVSLSSEGIDRKLNVALTRCKEQIIIIGNKAVIDTNETYAELIEEYKPVNI